MLNVKRDKRLQTDGLFKGGREEWMDSAAAWCEQQWFCQLCDTRMDFEVRQDASSKCRQKNQQYSVWFVISQERMF